MRRFRDTQCLCVHEGTRYYLPKAPFRNECLRKSQLRTFEMFTCTVQTTFLPRCILILRLTMGLSRWFASHPHVPKPCSLLGAIHTFLAIWQCVHRCFGKCFHSTHTRPRAVRPFLKCLVSSCWKGSLNSLNIFG